MCGCSKNIKTAWITVTFTGEGVQNYIGRNTSRNYGSFQTDEKVKILRGDYDPNVMRV